MDKNNLSGAANETYDRARGTWDVRRWIRAARAIDKGYDSAREYVSKGADYAGRGL